MFSYFGGDDKTPNPDLEQSQPGHQTTQEPLPDGLSVIDAAEKASITASIDQNAYVRREGAWQFRRDFAPKQFLIRAVALVGLWIVAHFSKPGTPRGREDKEWLQVFALLMIVLFAIMHGLAYLPTAIFGGITDLLGAARGHVSHAYSNYRDYQWCAAIFVLIVVCYPFIMFFSLLKDGFNPYDDLSHQEIKLEGGMTAQIVYLFRIVLHMFLLIAVICLAIMLLTLGVIRKTQRYPGQYTWLAVRMGKLPYGSLFFQEGEYFDCGICLAGIWKGSDVVRLGCNEKHVYHSQCLREQVNTHGNKYCVLCHSPLQVVNPPAPEPVDE